MDANITWFHKNKKGVRHQEVDPARQGEESARQGTRSPLRTRRCDGEDSGRACRCRRRVGLPRGIRDQDDGPELPRHQGRSFGSLPEQLARRSLTEGVRQEVPDVSRRGIEHPAGKSDDIARGRERGF